MNEPSPPPGQQTLTLQQTLDLGVQHHNAGDLTKAEGIYKQILQSHPDQPVVLHLLGVIAHQVGKNDVAVDLITKALAIKPDIAEAHSNLGVALQELGKLDEAVASYHKALAIKPDYATAHNNLGNALQELGKLDEAVASYHKAIAIKPNYAEAHNNIAVTLQELGKLDEAVASCHKALDIRPDFADAHNNLGAALQDLGRLEYAMASYRKALALKPDYAEAHYNLGNALQELGKLDEAVASYHKAIAIKPDYAEAFLNLQFTIKEKVAEFIQIICSRDQGKTLNANQLISEGVRNDALKVNLIYCPFVDPITPPVGIASLKAYLEKYGNTNVQCMDLNLKWHKTLIAVEQAGKEAIRKGESLFNNSDNKFFNIDHYRNTSSEFIDVLHNIHDSTQYSLCRDNPPQKNDIITFLKPLALDGSPDVVGFSVLFDSQILCSLLLAKEIKKENSGTIVVFGGAGMLSIGHQIIENSFVDFVVHEAGEAPFNELLNCIRTGKFNESIPGVAYKKDGEVFNNKAIPGNLNHEAYPDFSDFQLEGYFTNEIVISILSSKGCFWRRCSFCEEGSINEYAEASVNRVVDEIEHHFSNGHSYFQFVDEMIGPERLRLISREIIRRKLKVFFYGTLRPSADFNLETLQLMHRAGWRYVIWGVESCNRRVLKLVNKGTSRKTICNTLNASKDAGIRNHVFMFMGFPSETPDELFDTMQFFYDHQDCIHQVHSGVFKLCEGTEIFLNPEKFDIEIIPKDVRRCDYTVVYKKGTTSKKAGSYLLYYNNKFLNEFALAPAFGKLRDHALLHYAKVPLEDYEKVRKKVPQPVRPQIY